MASNDHSEDLKCYVYVVCGPHLYVLLEIIPPNPSDAQPSYTLQLLDVELAARRQTAVSSLPTPDLPADKYEAIQKFLQENVEDSALIVRILEEGQFTLDYTTIDKLNEFVKPPTNIRENTHEDD